MNSRNEVPYVKQSPAKYHAWIDRASFFIMPRGRTLRQNDVMYDIACSPQDYLYGMIYMGDFRETQAGLTNSKVKLLSVFPLKTSLVPRSIRIDTTSVLKLLDWDRPGCRTELSNREGELLERKNAAWDQFFNLNLRIFKGNQGDYAGEGDNVDPFTFDHQIHTDGISCAILMVRKSAQMLDRNAKRTRNRARAQVQQEPGTPSLTSISPEKRNDLTDKILIGIDPGLSDILYCVNGADHNEHQIQYRYTQNSRRKMLDIKKNQAQLKNRSKHTWLTT